MKRVLPPLNPLRMFEAAARHESFTHAAAELGVSQAAVSRQVAVLEAWLKTPLFERVHSELRLTETGRQYLEGTRGSFDAIDAATRAARAVRDRQSVQIRACATFAKYWLVPRLPRFAEARPELSVNLTTTVLPTTFEGTNLDAAIRFGHGQWPGLTAIKLVGDALAPVCNPAIPGNEQPLYRPTDVASFPILQSRHRRADWADWCSFTGVELGLRQATTLENSSQVYQAAREGAGIAIGQIRLLEEMLNKGELLMPFEDVLERPLGYFLVYPEHVRPGTKLRALKEWLLDEASSFR
jgi:LysR family glycine cleavage system transcriptional activator